MKKHSPAASQSMAASVTFLLASRSFLFSLYDGEKAPFRGSILPLSLSLTQGRVFALLSSSFSSSSSSNRPLTFILSEGNEKSDLSYSCFSFYGGCHSVSWYHEIHNAFLRALQQKLNFLRLEKRKRLDCLSITVVLYACSGVLSVEGERSRLMMKRRIEGRIGEENCRQKNGGRPEEDDRNEKEKENVNMRESRPRPFFCRR